MDTAWVYVVNNGGETPNIIRRSHPAITVIQVQPGEYVVNFPETMQALTCVATLNNSVGAITAIPGEESGLSANQVRVLTSTLDNELAGVYSFSLAVFSSSEEVTGQQTLHVQGRYLYDRCREQVILRGVNKMAVFESGDPTCAEIFPEIKKTGANVVRIVWLTDSEEVLGEYPKATVANLDAVIQNCRDHLMIPMIELHDATGDWSKLGSLVDFWIRPDVVSVVKKHQEYLLLNIGNEVGDDQVTDQEFKEGYAAAITAIRQAEIQVPLVIDAAYWGQEMSYLLNNAAELLATDSNLLFSLHVWWHYHEQPAADFVEAVNAAVAANIPLLVGEFSGVSQECQPGSPYPEILEKCQEAAIGWIAWEWGPGNEFGTPSCPAMNLTADGQFNSIQDGWARTVLLDHPYSIKNTAVTPRSIRQGGCE